MIPSNRFRNLKTFSKLIRKNCYRPHKPDSVSTLSFICPKHYCFDVAAYPVTLPFGIGRAALNRNYT